MVEVANTMIETTKFSVVVADEKAKEKEDLQVNLETILKSYNSIKEEVIGKDSIIAKLQSQLTG